MNRYKILRTEGTFFGRQRLKILDQRDSLYRNLIDIGTKTLGIFNKVFWTKHRTRIFVGVTIFYAAGVCLVAINHKLIFFGVAAAIDFIAFVLSDCFAETKKR
jgi:hypothetical protein